MRGARGKRWRENRSQRHKDAGVGYKGAFVCIDAYARETDGAADDAIGSEGLVEDDGAGDDDDNALHSVAHRLRERAGEGERKREREIEREREGGRERRSPPPERVWRAHSTQRAGVAAAAALGARSLERS